MLKRPRVLVHNEHLVIKTHCCIQRYTNTECSVKKDKQLTVIVVYEPLIEPLIRDHWNRMFQLCKYELTAGSRSRGLTNGTFMCYEFIHTQVPISVTVSLGQPVEAISKSGQKPHWAPPAAGSRCPWQKRRRMALNMELQRGLKKALYSSPPPVFVRVFRLPVHVSLTRQRQVSRNKDERLIFI